MLTISKSLDFHLIHKIYKGFPSVQQFQCYNEAYLKITHKVFTMRSKILFISLMLFSFSSVADFALTQADLLGVWQIDKESVQSDGSKSRSLNSTWTFKSDGTIEGISQDSDAHARTETIRATLNYSLEDGKLVKQAAPGRSKMETCAAVEKEGNKMVLHCQSLYFYMTKK